MHRALAGSLELRLDDMCHEVDLAAADRPPLRRGRRSARGAGRVDARGAGGIRVHAHYEASSLFDRALELWDRVDDAELLVGLDHIELLRQAAGVADGNALAGKRLVQVALAEVDREAEPARAALLLERPRAIAVVTGDGRRCGRRPTTRRLPFCRPTSPRRPRDGAGDEGPRVHALGALRRGRGAGTGSDRRGS